jgi:hypothetical protein
MLKFKYQPENLNIWPESILPNFFSPFFFLRHQARSFYCQYFFLYVTKTQAYQWKTEKIFVSWEKTFGRIDSRRRLRHLENLISLLSKMAVIQIRKNMTTTFMNDSLIPWFFKLNWNSSRQVRHIRSTGSVVNPTILTVKLESL